VTISWRVEACAVWSSRLWKQTLLTTASWLQVRTCSPLSGHAVPHAIYGSGQPYLDAYPLLPRYLKHPQHVQSAADTGMPGKCFWLGTARVGLASHVCPFLPGCCNYYLTRNCGKIFGWLQGSPHSTALLLHRPLAAGFTPPQAVVSVVKTTKVLGFRRTVPRSLRVCAIVCVSTWGLYARYHHHHYRRRQQGTQACRTPKQAKHVLTASGSPSYDALCAGGIHLITAASLQLLHSLLGTGTCANQVCLYIFLVDFFVSRNSSRPKLSWRFWFVQVQALSRQLLEDIALSTPGLARTRLLSRCWSHVESWLTMVLVCSSCDNYLGCVGHLLVDTSFLGSAWTVYRRFTITSEIT